MDLIERDARAVWHPFTPTPHRGPKQLFTRAKGAYVFDQEGKRYFDATSSWWCNLHGHCHPRLARKLAEQAETLDQILFAPHTHPVAIELAEALLQKLGPPFSKVFYSDDGSTAVEAAMKMALQFWTLMGKPEKRQFVSLDRAYHGDTLGVVSVSHLPEFHDAFTRAVSPSRAATVPYCYRCPLGDRYPSCEVKCADDAIDWIRKNHQSTAALLVEPLLMGAGGMLIYPKEYVERLTRACREHDVLVIFDEVFTGFGRTGKMFAQEHLEVRPDITCLSKGLTSGMLPMAVTAVTSRIHEPFVGSAERAFYHGHTFTGNALTAAVALESLKIFDDEKVLARNERLTQILAESRTRFVDLPRVGEVRHLGMVWALEVVQDKTSKAPFEPANGPGWRIAEALWQQGIWIRPLQQVIYLVPPYCTGAEELRWVLEVLYSELRKEAHFEAKDDDQES